MQSKWDKQLEDVASDNNISKTSREAFGETLKERITHISENRPDSEHIKELAENPNIDISQPGIQKFQKNWGQGGWNVEL
jgi:hypothetical protein